MKIALRYREGQFTPSEAATISGLALHLQRDWRSQGLLPAREGGRASFTPRDLAQMRIMVKLRALGLPLADAKRVADDAAPGVVYAALANHREKALAIDGPPDQAATFMEELERAEDGGYLVVLAELPAMERVYRHALVENGECELINALDENVMDERNEVAGLLNLWAIARAIVEAAPRPLFTLIIPRAAAAR